MPDLGGAAKTHQAVPDTTVDVAAIKAVTDLIPDAGAMTSIAQEVTSQSILTAIGGGTLGTTRYASPSGDNSDGLTWATAYHSINTAIADCVAGDTIFVEGGFTYNETATLAGLLCNVGQILIKSIGTSYATITNTDVTAAGAAVTITANDVILENFQISKGEAVSAGGAGVRFNGTTSSRLQDCIVGASNVATHTGVQFTGGSFGSGALGTATVLSAIVGSALGTALDFDDCTRCYASTTGLGVSNIGVRFAAAALLCSVGPGCVIQNCTTGISLEAGATLNILDARILESTTAISDLSGNATNTRTGSLTSLARDVQHIPQFTGEIWFVGKLGLDTNDGKTPDTAFLTIGYAISQAAASDAITVAAGLYDEAGRDMNLAGLELWCEIGVFLVDTTPGTCLIVSGAACQIRGAHFVQAGGIGVVVTGIGNIFEDCVCVNCTTGYDINEHSTQLFRCTSAGHTVTGFDIGQRNTVLRDCYSAGLGAGTRGFYLSAAAVTRSLLRGCNSVANGTAGFECVTGTAGNSLDQCTSGAGDGRWVDADSANTWPGFAFDHHVYKTTTFTGASATHNLFQVTGGVRIKNVYGHVKTILPSPGARTAYIQLYSTGGNGDITDSPGPDIQGLVVGAVLIRNADSTNQIDVGDPSGAPAIIENTNFRDPATAIDIVKDNGALTYVRLVLNNTFATGAIHWHAEWEPLTDDGFLAAV